MAGGENSAGNRRRSVTRDRFVVGQPQRWSGTGSNIKPPTRTTIPRSGYSLTENEVGTMILKNKFGTHLYAGPNYKHPKPGWNIGRQGG